MRPTLHACEPASAHLNVGEQLQGPAAVGSEALCAALTREPRGQGWWEQSCSVASSAQISTRTLDLRHEARAELGLEQGRLRARSDTHVFLMASAPGALAPTGAWPVAVATRTRGCRRHSRPVLSCRQNTWTQPWPH